MSAEEMTLCRRDGIELPLRAAPIRFAVTGEGGFTSNSWGVYLVKKGDAYVRCRDAMTDQKVSLHASGKQHIRISDSASRKPSLPGDGFMNQWWEPKHGKKAVPTLRLLFPPWGLSLDARQRAKVQDKWDKNDVLIPAHAEMVTVVSFVILDDSVRLRKEEGSPPSAPLGALKLGTGKSLFVIAGLRVRGRFKGEGRRSAQANCSPARGGALGRRKPGSVFDRQHGRKLHVHTAPLGSLPSSERLTRGGVVPGDVTQVKDCCDDKSQTVDEGMRVARIREMSALDATCRVTI